LGTKPAWIAYFFISTKKVTQYSPIAKERVLTYVELFSSCHILLDSVLTAFTLENTYRSTAGVERRGETRNKCPYKVFLTAVSLPQNLQTPLEPVYISFLQHCNE
jgi:hypothetical protein